VTDDETASPATLPGFDHGTDAALLTDHYAEWSRLRSEHGVFRSDIADGFDVWYVLGYEDVHDLLRDPSRFSSRTVNYLGDSAQRMIPVEIDPPAHGPYRQVLTKEFAPGSIAQLEPRIRARCAELIDSFFSAGTCDYANDFAFRLPTAIFLEMMGLDVARTDELVDLSKVVLGVSGTDDPDGSQRANAALEIVGHLVAGFEDRKLHPRDDLMTKLVQSTIDGHSLSDEELIAYGFLLYIAGLDTVANLLSYSMRHLATHTELRRSLVASPERWPTAVEELLRYFGIASVVRVVVSDTELAGCRLRAGDRIVAPLASAGRDPSAFEDADVFDPDRAVNRHLSFGAGPHRCLGAHLARLEVRIAMEEWHARVPDYEIPDGTVISEHVGAVAGINALPLAWPPR
jgi:cytochrome P450